jgi:hypothetical protein
MVVLAFDTLVALFLGGGLLLFVGLWLVYDRRDRRYYDLKRSQHVFHCVKCSSLYAGHSASTPVNCPRCGFANPSLRF